jgi:5-methylcytosine-specific restriction protein A
VDRQPFRFAGVADPVEHQATVPVTIRWRFGGGEMPTRDVFPDEVATDQVYREGAVRSVQVNAYERNPAARDACIQHYGTACVICGFDFGRVYGDIGQGFIHVHHLRELASIGQEYTIDPVADLRPVCPNCHAMLHTLNPAWSIDAMKAKVQQM